MTDYLLDRILFDPKPSRLTSIPWPDGLAPKLVPEPQDLKADVLVVTYTVAEAKALADVLSPGASSKAWAPYTDGFARFEPHLTRRSPALASRRLGSYEMVSIAGRRVLLFKSELHLATDSTELPLADLVRQLVLAVKPGLVITTGTAGGVGAAVTLGDVLITNSFKFNCAGAFKDAPFAQTSYKSATDPPVDPRTQGLMAVNASGLRPIATRLPMLVQGDVQTTDRFIFDDAEDAYGVRANDPLTAMEEMDDAVFPYALAGAGVPVVSVRNASDPQVPRGADLEAEKKWAAGVYAKYGYLTTVCSAIGCWGVIASHN